MLTFFNEHHAQYVGGGAAGAGLPAPDDPARTGIIAGELNRRGLGRIVTPHGVPLTSLERVHTPRYLHFLRTAWSEGQTPDAAPLLPLTWPAAGQRRDLEPDGFHGRLGLFAQDAITPITAGTWVAAKTGADCAVNAAHALRLGERGSFALTRPAGHHAGAESFGGGCFLNNAALAAQHLLDDGLSRVAILDLDPHHGSGTQSLFYTRRDVLTMSIHAAPRAAYPFYLGHADETGHGDGAGCNVNLPLAPGATSAQWFAALETACLRMAAYAPQALVVSLGVDDGIGARLAAADWLRVGERLGVLGLPAAFVLEGGGASPELGVDIVNVLEGFDTAS